MALHRRKIPVLVSTLVILASLPVVGGIVAGVDQPPRTELSVFDGRVAYAGGQPHFYGTISLLEGGGVLLRGVTLEIVDSHRRVIATERLGRLRGTRSVHVDVPLQRGDVSRVRLRVDSIDGTRSIEVNGLEADGFGTLVGYEESPFEFEY